MAYYWLNSIKEKWNTPMGRMRFGDTQVYNTLNENGKTRREKKAFEEAKVGDYVLGYEKRNAILAIFIVSKALDEKYITFKKIKNLNKSVTIAEFQKVRGLEKFPKQGSFFEITEEAFFEVLKISETILDPKTTIKDRAEYYDQVADSVLAELAGKLNNRPHLKFVRNLMWGPLSYSGEFDIGILLRGDLLSVVEIKLSPSVKEKFSRNRFCDYSFSHTSARFVILYTKETNAYYICNRGEEEMKETTVEYIAEKISLLYEESIEKLKNLRKKASVLKMSRSDNNVLDPSWCRKKLAEYNKNEVCRFSSLASLFSSLVYRTIRLNGLPGMNDKDEGLCAWNLIYTSEDVRDKIIKRDMEINNAFIVSYSDIEKEDDLTQWRLYGDDCKGVCCVYTIDKNKLKDRFYLHKVNYVSIEPPIKDTFLKNIRDYVNEHKVEYFDLSPIIFFYKPDDFKVEDEVRLLFDNKTTPAYETPPYKRDWLLTNSNNIPNPYIDVPLDKVPLKLKKVILGPNMSDIDIIAVQLKTMLQQQDMMDVIVEMSKVKSYRNPIR